MISAEEMFHWPIVTAEDEEAVVAIMRAGIMSGTDVTRKFEKEFAAWLGTAYTLGTCNGTAAIQEAFYACGVGPGTEVICPSMTYWASAAPAVSLGADVVKFAFRLHTARQISNSYLHGNEYRHSFSYPRSCV